MPPKLAKQNEKTRILTKREPITVKPKPLPTASWAKKPVPLKAPEKKVTNLPVESKPGAQKGKAAPEPKLFANGSKTKPQHRKQNSASNASNNPHAHFVTQDGTNKKRPSSAPVRGKEVKEVLDAEFKQLKGVYDKLLAHLEKKDKEIFDIYVPWHTEHIEFKDALEQQRSINMRLLTDVSRLGALLIEVDPQFKKNNPEIEALMSKNLKVAEAYFKDNIYQSEAPAGLQPGKK